MQESTRLAIFGPMRLPFVVLTPVCVMLGGAAAWISAFEFQWLSFLLALTGAAAAHISVNALNEYHDFKSGLDSRTRPTPFSGGSGTLPRLPDKAHIALITGLTSLLIALLVGVFFLFTKGPGLLPIILIGLFLVAAYTPLITRWPLICLIAPGLGFGPLMVMGTGYVVGGEYTLTMFMASLVPFFLVNDLLLLNQLPDMEADETAGRRHLPIVLGADRSIRIYGVFLLGAYLVILLSWLLGLFPSSSLIALGALFIAVPTYIGVVRSAGSIPDLIPHLGKNVIINLLTPLLLAIGLVLGGPV